MIKLSDRHYIKSDKYQFILYEKNLDENGNVKIYTDKNGSTREDCDVVSYHSSLPQALTSYRNLLVREKISTDADQDLADILSFMNETTDSILKQFPEFKA